MQASARLGTRLYISVASDEAKGSSKALQSADLAESLLRETNLRKLRQLPSTLPLYIGMRMVLLEKACARLLLMNGCLCILEEILFDENEELPTAVHAGEPIVLKYVPTHLLLRAVDTKWTLPDDQLPELPCDMNKQGLFLLPRATRYWSYLATRVDTVNVRRTHFDVIPADTRIGYSA